MPDRPDMPEPRIVMTDDRSVRLRRGSHQPRPVLSLPKANSASCRPIATQATFRHASSATKRYSHVHLHMCTGRWHLNRHEVQYHVC
jgi:hypothetical protein